MGERGASGRMLEGDAPCGLDRVLGSLERAIMEDIWENGPSSVRQVLDRLHPGHGVAYTTVMTVMGRLAAKGCLRSEKAGRAYRYSATLSRDGFLREVSRRMVDNLLADFGDFALAHFVHEVDNIGPDRLAGLRALARREDG